MWPPKISAFYPFQFVMIEHKIFWQFVNNESSQHDTHLCYVRGTSGMYGQNRFDDASRQERVYATYDAVATWMFCGRLSNDVDASSVFRRNMLICWEYKLMPCMQNNSVLVCFCIHSTIHARLYYNIINCLCLLAWASWVAQLRIQMNENGIETCV